MVQLPRNQSIHCTSCLKETLLFLYRYISNPTEILAELKAKGQSIPKAHGRIVAGDPAELIMISMAGKY